MGCKTPVGDSQWISQRTQWTSSMLKATFKEFLLALILGGTLVYSLLDPLPGHRYHKLMISTCALYCSNPSSFISRLPSSNSSTRDPFPLAGFSTPRPPCFAPAAPPVAARSLLLRSHNVIVGHDIGVAYNSGSDWLSSCLLVVLLKQQPVIVKENRTIGEELFCSISKYLKEMPSERNKSRTLFNFSL
jgi:hypothetical protein